MPGQEKALGCIQYAARATLLLRPNDPADPMEHEVSGDGGILWEVFRRLLLGYCRTDRSNFGAKHIFF